MSNIKFFMSSNPNNLRAINPDITIEAEYGDDVVEGSVATLAHHGSRAGNPAPCLLKNSLYDGVKIVGLSHIDLDTIGGCMAVMGIKPSTFFNLHCNAREFWETAAFVDVAGPHKIGACGASEKTKLQLAAYWAWSKDHRVFAPKDGSVVDVTNEILEACEAVKDIINLNTDLLESGREFSKSEAILNKNSFVEKIGNTILRVTSDFCNHLYTTPDGEICDSVVSFNTVTGAITLSFSDSDDSRNACMIMQNAFGKLAGGHKGVAGSPRGERMSFRNALAIVEIVTGEIY